MIIEIKWGVASRRHKAALGIRRRSHLDPPEFLFNQLIQYNVRRRSFPLGSLKVFHYF